MGSVRFIYCAIEETKLEVKNQFASQEGINVAFQGFTALSIIPFRPLFAVVFHEPRR